MTDIIYSDRIQWIAIAGSLVLLLFIFRLIITKRIKEIYSIWWVIFGIIFLGLSLWRDALDLIASWIGISYPPTALFLLFMMATLLIMIQFSMVISKLSESKKHLAQEIALLRADVEKLKQSENQTP